MLKQPNDTAQASDFKVHANLSGVALQSVEPSSPFSNPIFLIALEEQRCVGENSGWVANHIELPDHQIVIPSYLKHHSYGEYVFDWAWADAYQRHGLEYYPKLVTMQPFTPITNAKHFGPTLNSKAIKAWADSVFAICEQQQLSSWHCNFIHQQLANELAESGCMIRHGVQFEWYNKGYQHFDQFVATFTSRKRKNTNKERRIAQASVDQIHWKIGADICQTSLEAFYLCYQSTYLKRGQQGYLSFEFFDQLSKRMGDSMLLVTAEKNQKTIASALFFFDKDNLYGRYWGCIQDIDMLHFELCFYQGIEFAISRQIKRFNPGTQGEHKLYRGFEPTTTYSAHYIKQPDFAAAINNFCQQEKQQIFQYKQQCLQLLPFKSVSS
ncbi:GNAT family N-acetyltransferase [Agarivorans sp. MS3-6]|uniref:GNAT family N-acetyltransferase n=1 Tax=Agarivorans sp. TSD2052 TaxID=2937286 RepID=UPI00200E70C5|nr:GNAT family N-acetyltransferase [Agarivorans sp. TSD2052]UPW20391.1 GNAT family N-acetyltransferase [Agarivorans sp. TSD2052]